MIKPPNYSMPYIGTIYHILPISILYFEYYEFITRKFLNIKFWSWLTSFVRIGKMV